METCQSSNCLNLLNKPDSLCFDKLPFLSQLTQGNVIYLKRKPQNIAIDSSFETEKFSTMRGINSILLRVMLLHSKGLGCLFETAMPTFYDQIQKLFNRAFKWGIICFIIFCGSREIAQNIFLEIARTKIYVRQCSMVCQKAFLVTYADTIQNCAISLCIR